VIPKLGFGTWRLSGRECTDGVADALAAGYRHVDTAAMYGNEEEVGRGLRASGVQRSEIWLTTKVWPDDLEPDRVRASLEASLRRLGADYVDLFLIHWPNPRVPLAATLEAMTELRDEGMTREIGVSNFNAAQFREALDLAPVIVKGKGQVTSEPVIAEIGAAHGATPAQVALAWLVGQEGVSAVPKASSPERRRNNLGALELELSADERRRIDALPKDRRAVETDWSPDWD
jgi:2,5-diketo-D-gluconate reductase B